MTEFAAALVALMLWSLAGWVGGAPAISAKPEKSTGFPLHILLTNKNEKGNVEWTQPKSDTPPWSTEESDLNSLSSTLIGLEVRKRINDNWAENEAPIPQTVQRNNILPTEDKTPEPEAMGLSIGKSPNSIAAIEDSGRGESSAPAQPFPPQFLYLPNSAAKSPEKPKTENAQNADHYVQLPKRVEVNITDADPKTNTKTTNDSSSGGNSNSDSDSADSDADSTGESEDSDSDGDSNSDSDSGSDGDSSEEARAIPPPVRPPMRTVRKEIHIRRKAFSPQRPTPARSSVRHRPRVVVLHV